MKITIVRCKFFSTQHQNIMSRYLPFIFAFLGILIFCPEGFPEKITLRYQFEQPNSPEYSCQTSMLCFFPRYSSFPMYLWVAYSHDHLYGKKTQNGNFNIHRSYHNVENIINFQKCPGLHSGRYDFETNELGEIPNGNYSYLFWLPILPKDPIDIGDEWTYFILHYGEKTKSKVKIRFVQKIFHLDSIKGVFIVEKTDPVGIKWCWSWFNFDFRKKLVSNYYSLFYMDFRKAFCFENNTLK